MIINWKKGAYLALAGLIFTACENKPKEKESKESDSEKKEVASLDLQYMDRNLNPGEDFYNYVNGNWMKEAEIPDDQTTWGGFQMLRKQTDEDVLKILNKAKETGNYDEKSDQAKALHLFESYQDTKTRDEAGIEPVLPILQKIKEVENITDLQELIAKNPSEISTPFFGLSAHSDPDDSNTNIAYLSSGRLGLPDRDYYLNEKDEDTRDKYVAHITRMLQFLGDSEEDAKEQAELILKMETRLAEPRLTKVERRDFRNYNNRFAADDVKKVTPAVDWKKFYNDLGVEDKIDTLLVMEPKYMKELQNIFEENDVESWKTLTRWATLNSAASKLSTEIDRANWEFYSKTLNGTKERKPIDERALSVVNGSIGEAVGQLYVDEKFPPEAKAEAEEMVDNVIAAFQNRIEALDWMTEETKEKAIEKLDKFTVKIGYPDEWKDYSKMEVSADKNYYENRIAVSHWNYQKTLNDIGEPVDKKEWGMSPQTVNAYFNPMNNEIVFPAAILQPPFYYYKADAAINYGGMGAVIGHEISHAFDDSGARFDAHGNLKNWWSDEDLENFTSRGKKLADLYSNIEVLDDVYINGDFTLGENIGDLGGVLGAYDALQMHLEKEGRPGEIDGFTPEQRFFISWATVWRTKTREEALKTKIKTDPHSPGMYRAYVPLQNVDAFYEAFDIKEGEDMYIAPEDRVRIW
ncbi:MAG: M13 family metallopeptidase [Bacteroidota bacterium]